MTIEALAGRLGITKAQLSRIETGKQRVSDDLLPKLVAATGIAAAKYRPDLAKLFRGGRAQSRARAA